MARDNIEVFYNTRGPNVLCYNQGLKNSTYFRTLEMRKWEDGSVEIITHEYDSNKDEKEILSYIPIFAEDKDIIIAFLQKDFQE